MKRSKLALVGLVTVGAVALTACNQKPSLKLGDIVRGEGGTLIVSGTAGDIDGDTLLELSVGDEVVDSMSLPRDGAPFSFSIPTPASQTTPICVWVRDAIPDSHLTPEHVLECRTAADAVNASVASTPTSTTTIKPKPTSTSTSTTSTSTTSTSTTTTTEFDPCGDDVPPGDEPEDLGVRSLDGPDINSMC